MNVVYTTECQNCKEQGNRTQYVGETARSLALRGEEHLLDAAAKKENSHMYLHNLLAHPGAEMSFKFDLVYNASSALDRQVRETIHLKMLAKQGVHTVNSKVEYNRCLPAAHLNGGRPCSR